MVLPLRCPPGRPVSGGGYGWKGRGGARGAVSVPLLLYTSILVHLSGGAARRGAWSLFAMPSDLQPAPCQPTQQDSLNTPHTQPLLHVVFFFKCLRTRGVLNAGKAAGGKPAEEKAGLGGIANGPRRRTRSLLRRLFTAAAGSSLTFPRFLWLGLE